VDTNLDGCPIALTDNKINIKHHLIAVNKGGLGPANPLERNDDFWTKKAVLWGIPEGDARGRLCNNCEYYFDNEQIRDCISNGPANDLKASALPLTPAWADIESHPVGYCTYWDITCSPIRTCDKQEIFERPLVEEDETTSEDNPILDYKDPFKSTLED
jgi:hypothetical protein